jgi:hypothetical protein
MFGRRDKSQPQSKGPKVEPLSEGEVGWRDAQLAAAALIAERYTETTEAIPSLERLDACIAAWLADDASRVDVNTLVNAVGVAFGCHLASKAALDWVIATDEQGSDLALHGEPGNIILFPANAVAKRVAAGEIDFIVSLHNAMVGVVEQRRAKG